MRLGAGETLALDAAAPRLLLVLSGELEYAPRDAPSLRLVSGDSLGDAEVLAGRGRDGTITARSESELLELPGAAVEQLLRDFPVMALPMVAELARELKWRN